VSDITDKVKKLAKECDTPIHEVMNTYLGKEQQWYDRALRNDIRDGIYMGILHSRPKIGQHVLDVMERYVEMKYK